MIRLSLSAKVASSEPKVAHFVSLVSLVTASGSTRGVGITVLLGGPGSGKSTQVAAAVSQALSRGERAVALGFGREQMATLRDRIEPPNISREPYARTLHALAFSIVQEEFRRSQTLRPHLLSGPEQDVVIRELLDEEKIRWSAELGGAPSTRGFAKELREFLSILVESKISTTELVRLSETLEMPDWKSVAEFAEQYWKFVREERPGAIDPSSLISRALLLVEKDPSLIPIFDFVAVDDIDEANPIQRSFIQAVSVRAKEIFITSNPSATIGKFRGADPDGTMKFIEKFAKESKHDLVLRELQQQYRATQEINQHLKTVSESIPRSSYIQALKANKQSDIPKIKLFTSAIDEATAISLWFQELHLLHGIPYSEMAIIRRDNNFTLNRISLTSLGIPFQHVATTSLAERNAVTPLLNLIEIIQGDESLILDALTSPYVDGNLFDRRTVTNAHAQHPQSSLREIIADTNSEPCKRLQKLLITTEKALNQKALRVDEIIWKIWEVALSAGFPASQWQAIALSRSRRSEAAHENLDAVIELLKNATRFSERYPQRSITDFIVEIRSQDFDADFIKPRQAQRESVSMLSVHRSRAKEWEVVAIAGVNDGIWPNLSPRGSLLQGDQLLEFQNSNIRSKSELKESAKSALQTDERRLFLAAIGKSKTHLLISGVNNEDERPSSYIRDDAQFESVSDLLTKDALVGKLRSEIDLGNEKSAAILGYLAGLAIPGADLDDWYGYRSHTDPRPVAQNHESIYLSPSAIDSFITCPLKWLLSSNGGQRGEGENQQIGILIHEIAQELVEISPTEMSEHEAQLMQKLEQGLSGMDLGRGWVRRNLESDAKVMLSRLFEWHRTHGEVIATEVPFAFEVDRVIVRGQIDRIEAHEDKLQIIDIKTGKSMLSGKLVEETYQLKTYQLAIQTGSVANLNDKEIKNAGLLYLNHDVKDTEKLLRSQGSINPDQVKEELIEIGQKMSADRFEAIESNECRQCVVRSSCPLKSRLLHD